jgi:hypothetical protein
MYCVLSRGPKYGETRRVGIDLFLCHNKLAAAALTAGDGQLCPMTVAGGTPGSMIHDPLASDGPISRWPLAHPAMRGVLTGRQQPEPSDLN